MAKYLDIESGVLTQKQPISTSAGAGDASKLVQTDAGGKLDSSLMPAGLGVDQFQAPASEALGAGDWVNIWNDAGTMKVRKADASAAGKEANGFVLAAFAQGATATVYTADENNQVSGRTAGAVQYLSAATPGGSAETPPSGSGQVVQRLGRALSATSVTFRPGDPVVLA